MDNMQWDKIIGHGNKISNLREMIKNQKFPHSLIMSGISGIGKRKIAEIAAAALLCENEDAPCGKCQSCRNFLSGTHSDYYLIEPDMTKANPVIKIGQIREMQREVSLMPMLSDRRVVVIDGAEYMNNVSQNCLLKTIEEPQGQSTFILITANRSKLLLTLLSRCMVINFDKLTESEITRGLNEREIIDAEKIAVISNGSLGQAITLASNGGLKLREDAINFLETLDNLTIEEIFNRGQRFSELSKEQVLEWLASLQKFLRDLLIVDANVRDEFYYNRDLKERLQKLNFEQSRIFKMISETAELRRRLMSNATLRLMIESYFMKLRFGG